MEALPKFPDLAGQSVFITGGGKGIGAALTEAFLAQGARVAFVQRSDASAFCDELEARTGARPLFIPCDVTDTAALRRALGQAAKAHGPVTVLVNNAANDERRATLEVDEAFWDEAQAINLRPYFFASQAAIEGMRAAGGGAIVNFSSIACLTGEVGYPAYVAANAAITGLTRSLAREFGADGIRVNAIAPGWVLTERQRRKWASPEALAAHLERQALKRHLAPKDMVGPALFLASTASAMVTGQTLVVDGGVVMAG
ncbi:MAG: SDR family oxidoreductase [Alphaproteobacteria bacterium]|nr:MAG: SDR family oxidoreductase [Alphaproteobacteria bacterium]